MSVPGISSGELTVTQRLLGMAGARGGHRALLGGGVARTYNYGDLAATVQAAAAGLASRGLQPRDVVGIYAPDAACHALAVQAVRAAGGIPSRSARRSPLPRSRDSSQTAAPASW